MMKGDERETWTETVGEGDMQWSRRREALSTHRFLPMFARAFIFLSSLPCRVELWSEELNR